jgi:hypothetical protein
VIASDSRFHTLDVRCDPIFVLVTFPNKFAPKKEYGRTKGEIRPFGYEIKSTRNRCCRVRSDKKRKIWPPRLLKASDGPDRHHDPAEAWQVNHHVAGIAISKPPKARAAVAVAVSAEAVTGVPIAVTEIPVARTEEV